MTERSRDDRVRKKIFMSNYKGVIIEESLKSPVMPEGLRIISTEVKEVTKHHKTPWLKKWTLHTVEVEENRAEEVAHKISHSLETEHGAWYADFKNGRVHYVIFPNKVFNVTDKNEYQKVRDYGLSLGIPDYQLAFEEMK